MIGGIRMLNNKKGFTLVELLAVIVILAIILAIAIPSISGVMENAKESAFSDNVKLIIKGIDYKTLEASTNGSTAPTTGVKATTELSNYGANSGDYSTFEIVSFNPTKISITGASNGKFGTCSVTNATLTNITQTGESGDGVITGC
jgi:type IV pilus assembly protein PilA